MEDRSTFQFSRSFFDAAKKIQDKEMQADFLLAVCNYALNGAEPESDGIIGAMFELVRPNLDVSRKRAQAGRNGGEAKRKQTEANGEQNEAKATRTDANGSKDEANEKQIEANLSDPAPPFSPLSPPLSLPPEPPISYPPIIPPESPHTHSTPTTPDGVVPPQDDPDRTPIPYEAIRAAYNETCKHFPKCTVLSTGRKKAIRARFSSGYQLEDFELLFRKADASKFLRGQNKNNWTASFDWLIKDANMAKVLDGNYDSSGGVGQGQQSQRQSWAELARQMDAEEGMA